MIQREPHERLMRPGHRLPFDLDFLRALGFEFSLDWDDEVLVKPPASLEVRDVAGLIAEFKDLILRRLKTDAHHDQQVCVGGPCSGKRHDGCGCTPILFHLCRRSWAVYKTKSYPSTDERAWFIGMTTSKAKARRMWYQARRPEPQPEGDS